MRYRRSSVAVLLACLALLAPSAEGGRHLRVGLDLETVTVGAATDPFQEGPYLGMARAVRDFGVTGKLVAPAPSPDPTWVPSLTYLAQQRYDLTIALGLLEAADLDVVARRFPSRRFAILDTSWAALQHRPKNVVGTVFRSEQGAYLAGYLAALMEHRRPEPHVVSAVGGFKIPSVDALIAGFAAGAQAADPRVRVLHGYATDFLNASKCGAVARRQIARGSGVVFDVAGACGIGALRAAKRAHVWGVGVDVDQGYLGAFVLTSVTKRLDVAVYDLVRALTRRRLRTGRDLTFDLRNGGVGLGRFSPSVPAVFTRRLAAVRRAIVSGRIRIPVTIP